MKLETYLVESKLTQEEFAVRLGVTQSMVSQWIRGIRPVSPQMAIAIEEATSGEILRSDIRPDLWDSEVA